MREELQRRIGAAIDSAEGITGDAELRALLAEDADAAAYARDVVHLQSTLRSWPLPEPSDDAFETLAARIEQRLGDTLPRIADPTLAPQFDDDDDLRDATAGLLGPVTSSGEIELEESHSVPPPARRIPPPSPMRTAVSQKAATAPMPAAPPSAKPVPREMPKLAPASDGDRLSFPSFTPPPLDAPAISSARVGDLEKKRRERARFGWIGGLAAAAAVGLGVFAATSTYQGESALAPPSAGVTATATATGGVMAADMEESSDPAAAPAEAPEPAQDMMAQASPSAPAAAPYPPGAASVAAAPAPRLPADEAGESFGGTRDGLEGRALRRRARAAPPPAALPMRIGGAAPAARAPMEESAASGGGGARGEAPRTERARAPAATSAPADLPAAPERGAVLAAIQAVEPAVRACAADEHGTATVRIVVAGSGRVTTATVSGQFSGTPVGSCVARAVRTGRFPQFSGDRFEVTYPFQL